jgi:hypothetical protein
METDMDIKEKHPESIHDNQTAFRRYQETKKQIPLPGCGNDYHTFILGIANRGVLAKVDPQQIFDDIREHTPPGKRHVSDREIQDAVSKAFTDISTGTFTPKPKPAPVVQDGKAALQKIIEQSNISDAADLWELSPIRLHDEPKEDPALLLVTLYKEDNLIFIGERQDTGVLGGTIRKQSEWLPYFLNGGLTKPFIIVNPLTGLPAQKESGEGETYRGNGNIAEPRHCLAEFDTLSRENQIRFWTAIRLPIVALIDSGGKSIHAWIDVQKLSSVMTLEQWQTNIKGRLYDKILAPLGVDKACANPAHLSRLPGHFREEKGAWQRLLWLSPEGKPICQK